MMIEERRIEGMNRQLDLVTKQIVFVFPFSLADGGARTSRRSLLNILFYALTTEKALQHLLTAIFFTVDLPGIGTPDTGTFPISNSIMALLNLVYFAFFIIGIIGKNKTKKRAIKLIIVLACLDIFLEFLFHGFFFITVSVIMSTILTIVSIFYLRMNTETESPGRSSAYAIKELNKI